MPKRRQQWQVGDVFAVPTLDGQVALGQIVGREAEVLNSVTVALFDQRYPSVQEIPTALTPEWTKVYAVLFTTRDLLDSGHWKVVGTSQPKVPKDLFPYEHLRKAGFVGARVIGSGIVNRLINAFYGLAPWDDWKEPDYLDTLLISPERKPKERLVYKAK